MSLLRVSLFQEDSVRRHGGDIPRLEVWTALGGLSRCQVTDMLSPCQQSSGSWKEGKGPLHPSTLATVSPSAPIRRRTTQKKTSLKAPVSSKIISLPMESHGSVARLIGTLFYCFRHSLALVFFFSLFLSLSLSLSHTHTHTLYHSFLNVPHCNGVALRPPSLPLLSLLSLLQCHSLHPACLQAVSLISLNYSRHFLFSPSIFSTLYAMEPEAKAILAPGRKKCYSLCV